MFPVSQYFSPFTRLKFFFFRSFSSSVENINDQRPTSLKRPSSLATPFFRISNSAPRITLETVFMHPLMCASAQNSQYARMRLRASEKLVAFQVRSFYRGLFVQIRHTSVLWQLGSEKLTHQFLACNHASNVAWLNALSSGSSSPDLYLGTLFDS